MTILPGEIWVADVPFTAGQASKVRPVLILWLDGNDAIVAVITTATPRTNFDVPLNDWAAAGLRKPSTVRLARLDCLEMSSLLVARIGRLSTSDGEVIKQTWAKFVKPQF